MNFDRNKVEMVKKQYPVGTRIRLNSLCNDERDMPAGLCGTVIGVDSHPGLLNLFVNDVRRDWQALGLFDKGHCTGADEDFQGKVLVLNPTVLKDSYKTPDYQLFLVHRIINNWPN